MRAGCRCENMVLVCLFVFLSRSETGALFVLGRHNLNKYVVMFHRSILVQFSPPYSKGNALSDKLERFHFSARGRHNIREISLENCVRFRNRRKSLCAQLRIDKRQI